MRHALDCGMCCGLQVCDCGAEPKWTVVGYRSDMSDVEAWQRHNQENEPVSFEQFYRMKLAQMNQLDSRQPPG